MKAKQLDIFGNEIDSQSIPEKSITKDRLRKIHNIKSKEKCPLMDAKNKAK